MKSNRSNGRFMLGCSSPAVRRADSTCAATNLADSRERLGFQFWQQGAKRAHRGEVALLVQTRECLIGGTDRGALLFKLLGYGSESCSLACRPCGQHWVTAVSCMSSVRCRL